MQNEANDTQQRRRGWSEHLHSIPIVLALATAVLAADYITGPFIQFPILFVGPVALAAWYHRRRWGLALAVIMPVLHTAMTLHHRPPWTLADTAINAVIRLVVLVLFAVLVDQAAQRQRLAEEVRVLRGLLPICAYCKRIRDPQGHWEVFETYIASRSEAEFSHGLCAACARKHFGVTLKED